jgi:hypothetical protein
MIDAKVGGTTPRTAATACQTATERTERGGRALDATQDASQLNRVAF